MSAGNIAALKTSRGI